MRPAEYETGALAAVRGRVEPAKTAADKCHSATVRATLTCLPSCPALPWADLRAAERVCTLPPH